MEVGERSITGPDLIRDTFEKVDLIWKRLLIAQSRLKRYANRRRRPLEFEVGDHVFLKVMPKRGVVGFEKRGNYRRDTSGPSRYFREGWYSCITPSLSSVHEVFHVSMLRKYTPDLTHVVD